MSPSITIEGFLETGSFSFLNYESSRMRLGSRGMWFPGNSFFLAGGLAFDHYSSELKSGLLGSSQSWEGSMSQLEIEFSIGNRWSMDSGFFIGAQWVGYSLGIVELSRDSKASGGMSDASKASYEDSLDKLKSYPGLHFAKLQLGWAF